MQIILKAFLSLVVIFAATGAAKRLPAAGGLIATMPLAGALVLVWVYLENGGEKGIMQVFSKGALWGILQHSLLPRGVYLLQVGAVARSDAHRRLRCLGPGCAHTPVSHKVVKGIVPGYRMFLGCPVRASTFSHSHPCSSIFLRCDTASGMGTCVNWLRQWPTTMFVLPLMAAWTA